jgi:hypothetical protein
MPKRQKAGEPSTRTQIQLLFIRTTQHRNRQRVHAHKGHIEQVLPDKKEEGKGRSPALIPRILPAYGAGGERPKIILKEQAL